MIACIYLKANIVQESKSKYGISGYTIINIGYTLLSSDPTKMSNITLDVDPSDGADEDVDARITVDNGATWVTCTYLDADKWVCSFPTFHEPGIASISNLRLMTKTPVPWCKKLVFSLLQIFNR